ncbi:unnamed protein product [Caenorhabditis bovis]|uniref:Uncharacterized protein n=1 Tax=Caenorhabditis bovis TaxID=2654633 RepID=A0A8S1EW37_9PELO|nr:unnamed protein product [Caenorhabditis bovis]
MLILYLLSIFNVFISVNSVNLGDLKLVLVQAIWRHGDRAPQTPFRTDPIKESDWIFGGGGYGELTPIHIRSTDRNRTIISALSNIYGMYSVNNSKSRSGIDYPDIAGWTPGFIPIAVHTRDYDSDCVANVECDCPRRDALQDMAHTLPDYVNYTTSPEFLEVLQNLTTNTGENITADNLWTVPDALLCERIHFYDRLISENTWYSDEFYTKIQRINHRTSYFTCGIYAKPSIVNSIDVGKEIIKIRSGPITNEIYDRMTQKLDCAKNPKCTNQFIRNLQYYAYSAHDETIYSLMTSFGIEDNAAPDPGEWPAYSASIFVELFTDNKNDAYFSLVYRANENATFVSLTKTIPDCKSQDYCPIEVFKKYAEMYKPDQDITSWCQVLPSNSSRQFFGFSAVVVAIFSIFRI